MNTEPAATPFTPTEAKLRHAISSMRGVHHTVPSVKAAREAPLPRQMVVLHRRSGGAGDGFPSRPPLSRRARGEGPTGTPRNGSIRTGGAEANESG